MCLSLFPTVASVDFFTVLHVGQPARFAVVAGRVDGVQLVLRAIERGKSAPLLDAALELRVNALKPSGGVGHGRGERGGGGGGAWEE